MSGERVCRDCTVSIMLLTSRLREHRESRLACRGLVVAPAVLGLKVTANKDGRTLWYWLEWYAGYRIIGKRETFYSGRALFSTRKLRDMRVAGGSEFWLLEVVAGRCCSGYSLYCFIVQIVSRNALDPPEGREGEGLEGRAEELDTGATTSRVLLLAWEYAKKGRGTCAEESWYVWQSVRK